MTIPAWVHQAIATYGYWAVLVAVALEGMGVPIPGETSLIAAAVYAGTGNPLNIFGVIAAAICGAILGDNTGYSIGRFGGLAVVRRFGRYIWLTEERLAPAQRYFARHGNKTVFFGRYVAILRTYVSLLAGLNAMRWRVFFIWDAAAVVIWASIYGALGYVLGRHLQLLGEVVDALGIAGIVLAVLAVVAVVGVLVWRHMHAKG